MMMIMLCSLTAAHPDCLSDIIDRCSARPRQPYAASRDVPRQLGGGRGALLSGGLQRADVRPLPELVGSTGPRAPQSIKPVDVVETRCARGADGEAADLTVNVRAQAAGTIVAA